MLRGILAEVRAAAAETSIEVPGPGDGRLLFKLTPDARTHFAAMRKRFLRFQAWFAAPDQIAVRLCFLSNEAKRARSDGAVLEKAKNAHLPLLDGDVRAEPSTDEIRHYLRPRKPLSLVDTLKQGTALTKNTEIGEDGMAVPAMEEDGDEEEDDVAEGTPHNPKETEQGGASGTGGAAVGARRPLTVNLAATATRPASSTVNNANAAIQARTPESPTMRRLTARPRRLPLTRGTQLFLSFFLAFPSSPPRAEGRGCSLLRCCVLFSMCGCGLPRMCVRCDVDLTLR